MAEEFFIQGNEACAKGAIAAGCRFFAGYPITPSTEVAETLARELPKVGGSFVQMEDEIASAGAIIGGSWGGTKSMTATSGPGISLMQENIGYAFMTETPIGFTIRYDAGPLGITRRLRTDCIVPFKRSGIFRFHNKGI